MSETAEAWREPEIRIETAERPTPTRRILADGQHVATIRFGVVPQGFEHSPNPRTDAWYVFDVGDVPVQVGSYGRHDEVPAFAAEDTERAREFWLEKMAGGDLATAEQARALLAEYTERRANPTATQLERLAGFWSEIAERLKSLGNLASHGVREARGYVGPDFAEDEALAREVREQTDRLLRAAEVRGREARGAAQALKLADRR
jgi:hypothetical protein